MIEKSDLVRLQYIGMIIIYFYITFLYAIYNIANYKNIILS